MLFRIFYVQDVGLTVLQQVVYPLYLAKVEKKGDTREEPDQVISWLTAFTNDQLQDLISQKANFESFFAQASPHPNASLITGLICGIVSKKLKTGNTKVRYLDRDR